MVGLTEQATIYVIVSEPLANKRRNYLLVSHVLKLSTELKG